MLFSSFQYFCAFLPVVVGVAILLRKAFGPRAAQTFVVLASFIFYGWMSPANIPYLAASIVANWLFAHRIASSAQPARKRWLIAAIAINVGYLFLFKYANFFLASIGSVLHFTLRLPDLGFPLGVSFFTIAQVGYLVDAYEDLVPALGFFDHLTFAAFFPYIISGPIARARRMLHQVDDFGGKPGRTAELLARGLFLFTIGLAKKSIFAAGFSALADAGFTGTGAMSASSAWFFSLAYSFQIYFDFSGYSDMAIGSALMLGIEIPRNFDAPFRSRSLAEFWQRWHISLSQFITTYLYTPVIKSFRKATLVNSGYATIFAMSIAGLWHGPNWTFLLYGFLHGCGLVVNQVWRKKKMPRLPPLLSTVITFAFVNLCLIPFRSPSLAFSLRMAASLFNPRHLLSTSAVVSTIHLQPLLQLVVLPVAIVLAFAGKSSDQLSNEFRPTFAGALAASGMLTAAVYFLVFFKTASFIYFQF